MQKIYNKLAKKTRSVKLGQVNEMNAQLDEYLEEMNQLAMNSENALADVQRAIGEIRILQESKIPLLRQEATEIITKVADLGLDLPEELYELEEKLTAAYEINVDAADLFDAVETMRFELYPFMK